MPQAVSSGVLDERNIKSSVHLHPTVRIIFWTSIPSEHQRGFFDELRKTGRQVSVRYYSAVPKYRVDLGWENPQCLHEEEAYTTDSIESLKNIPGWISVFTFSRVIKTRKYGNYSCTYARRERPGFTGASAPVRVCVGLRPITLNGDMQKR
jgi:hypothetical protein